MWTIKEGVVSVKGRDLERHYLDSDEGVRLIFFKSDQGEDIFEYQEGDLSLEFTATRVDPETLVMGDCYTVHLGIALQVAAVRQPSDVTSIERARHIAANIKSALLLWRYPPPLRRCNVVSYAGTRH
jgi:hypothetical protein